MGSRSVSNKRQWVGDTHGGSYVNFGVSHPQRALLGAYWGGNVGCSASLPTKMSSMKHVPDYHTIMGYGIPLWSSQSWTVDVMLGLSTLVFSSMCFHISEAFSEYDGSDG
jgi:hypothetical protein